MKTTKNTWLKTSLKLFAAVLLMGTVAFGFKADTASAATQLKPSSYVPMYRVYNPNSGEHFYTNSSAEKSSLVTAGWNDEGIGWYAPVQAISTTPVWRNYNPNSGEHYYTTNFEEANWLITQFWNGEGIGWYSADSGSCSSSDMVPVYCVFNPNCPGDVPASHHYTVDINEKNYLVSIGWRDEGVAFYGVPDQTDNENAIASKPVLTIDQDTAYASIEATMTLPKTAATGLHSKVVIATNNGTGAVASFGVQYEEDLHNAYPQYQGNTVFLMENVYANAAEAGTVGKHYLYLKEASLNSTYKIRLSWSKSDNKLHCYVNDQEISYGYDQWTTTNFEPPFTFALEGSVAHSGDSIDATFSDIKVKVGSDSDVAPIGYGTEGVWNDSGYDFFGLDGILTNAGTNGPSAAYQNDKKTFGYNASVRITGTANITDNGGICPATGAAWDWDTCFSAVDPKYGTAGHPLSGQVVIAQKQTGN